MKSILFTNNCVVFTNMSRSYEGLKHFTEAYIGRPASKKEDQRFYQALRRLYYAELACVLCQYYSDPSIDLSGIEPFRTPDVPQPGPEISRQQLLTEFLNAWDGIKDSLRTKDGEKFLAVESYEYMESLASAYTRVIVERLPPDTLH